MELMVAYCNNGRNHNDEPEDHKRLCVTIGNAAVCQPCLAKAGIVFGEILINKMVVQNTIAKMQSEIEEHEYTHPDQAHEIRMAMEVWQQILVQGEKDELKK